MGKISSLLGRNLRAFSQNMSLHDCPVFKTGSCPFTEATPSFQEDLKKCAAFKDGCPFKETALNPFPLSFVQNFSSSSSSSSSHPPIHKNSIGSSLKEKCPAFKEGCPFKNQPTSLLEDLKKCPAFHDGCPFVSMTSKGETLLSALKKYRWNNGFIFDEEENQPKFASKIKEGTKVVHELAEHSAFITKFRKGTLDRSDYFGLLCNLYRVYCELETQLEIHKNHPVISQIYFPELHRKEALEADLRFFGDFDELLIKNQSSLGGPVHDYIQRIKECGQKQPELLVAHSYTRYLGDLSGGQILKRLVKRCFNLNSEEGTRFYDFPLIPVAKTFKTTYRQRLNDLKFENISSADQIVQEAVQVFVLNINLFRDLAGETPIQYSEFEKKQQTTNIAKSTQIKKGECPFHQMFSSSPTRGTQITALTKSTTFMIISLFVLIISFCIVIIQK